MVNSTYETKKNIVNGMSIIFLNYNSCTVIFATKIFLSVQWVSGEGRQNSRNAYLIRTKPLQSRLFCFCPRRNIAAEKSLRAGAARRCDTMFLLGARTASRRRFQDFHSFTARRDLPINHCNSACPAPSPWTIRVRICISDYTGREEGNGPRYRYRRAKRSYA